jgi:hypothetical protein
LIEQFGPTGLGSSIFSTAFNVTAFQSGFVYHTIFVLISFFLFLLFCIFFNIIKFCIVYI